MHSSEAISIEEISEWCRENNTHRRDFEWVSERARAPVGIHKTYTHAHTQTHYKYIERWLPFDFDLVNALWMPPPVKRHPRSEQRRWQADWLAGRFCVWKNPKMITTAAASHCEFTQTVIQSTGTIEKNRIESEKGRVRGSKRCVLIQRTANGLSFALNANVCVCEWVLCRWNGRIIKYNNIICENVIDWIPIEL